MKFFNHDIIETVRLNNHAHGEGTAYVLDRLKNRPTLEQIAYWEDRGAIVSERSYRYAPEIRETFVFVPDSVMVWACPNEECDGVYLDDPQILEKHGDWWECPNCHCSTVSPIDDACISMLELV